MAYKKLFSIRLTHRYFELGKKGPFAIEPSEDCLKLMRRFSLLFRYSQHGFSVYYKLEEENSELPWQPIDEVCVFTFFIYSEDPYLFNYSSLPFFKPGQRLLYFTNLEKKGRKGKTLSLVASSTPFVDVDDLVALQRKKFSRNLTKKPEITELRNEAGADFSNCLSLEGEELKVDLSGKTPGLFTLQTAADNKYRFYADNSLRRRVPVGVIRLHVSKEVSAKYRFVNAKLLKKQEPVFLMEPKSYHIQITERSTFWRYYLVSGPDRNIDPEKLVIRNEGKDLSISFLKSANPFVLDSGEEAVVFTSSDPIPLREKAYTNLELNVVDELQEQSLIYHLPNPEVSEISFMDDTKNSSNQIKDPAADLENVKTPFSNIFVYY